jgi:hypothetical protein
VVIVFEMENVDVAVRGREEVVGWRIGGVGPWWSFPPITLV